jgi:hypothetical protein
MTAPTTTATLSRWRALFWEPVAGTGERLAVGVVYEFGGKWAATRIIRDDVLDALYGKQSAAARSLIEHGLSIYQAAAAAGGIEHLSMPLGGLFPTELRQTEATSIPDVLRTAALLYSSLAQIESFDLADDTAMPLPEEVNRRFSTDVKSLVIGRRPDLATCFGQGGKLTDGGQTVRFGFFSPKAVLHFSVLHPNRQSASVRDGRARLWELHRAKAASGIPMAALIMSMPKHDDPTLGSKQRDQFLAHKIELQKEAAGAQILLHAVTTAGEAADRVIEAAA